MSAWLRLHAHALADAVRRLAAHPVASLFSILVVALALMLPLLGAVALRSVAAATAGLEVDPHLNVFLALDATDADVRRVEAALKARPEAAAVRFVPRNAAFEELRATTHLAEILATLDHNPLPHAFTIRLRAVDPAGSEALKAEVARIPKVDQVQADFEWSRRLGGWIRFGNRVLGVFGIALAAAVVFIVAHLIRLQVVTRRQEIEVSQLMGATAADVRRPLLYHGLLQGILAGGAAVALTGLLAWWVGAELRALAPDYGTELKVVFLGPIFCAAAVLAAGAMGFAGAWIAVSRELRRFSSP